MDINFNKDVQVIYYIASKFVQNYKCIQIKNIHPDTYMLKVISQTTYVTYHLQSGKYDHNKNIRL